MLKQISYLYELSEGVYTLTTFPECDIGVCVQPRSETMAFESVEEAILFAAAHGYVFGDPFSARL